MASGQLCLSQLCGSSSVHSWACSYQGACSVLAVKDCLSGPCGWHSELLLQLADGSWFVLLLQAGALLHSSWSLLTEQPPVLPAPRQLLPPCSQCSAWLLFVMLGCSCSPPAATAQGLCLTPKHTHTLRDVFIDIYAHILLISSMTQTLQHVCPGQFRALQDL